MRSSPTTNNTRARILAATFLAFTPLTLRGAATIVIVNGDPPGVGFNDPAAVAPVGGNSGTTLGQQRLIAFQSAADKWGATLTSSAVIRVNAVWTPLPCTANSGVIGSAGPSEIWRDFPGAAVSGRWYPKALANRQSNSDLDATTEDISANFNVNLGKPDCLEGAPFYLGIDNHPGGKVDLVSVLEHEFAHGLGFHTSTNRRTGEFVDGVPGVADDFLTDTTVGKNWTSMSAAERAASAVRTGRLVWTGGNVTYALPRVLKQSGTGLTGADSLSRALMYAPSEYDSGSSVVHWDTSASPNQLMEPQYNDDLTHEVTPPVDLTYPMLQDIGWSTGAAPLPRLQLTSSHTSDFTQGQNGAQTIQVANTGNAPTVGMVNTLLSLPSGLTTTAMQGSGWNCSVATATCSRSDALAGGASYPPITAALHVGASAPTQVTSVLGAWGGGSLPAAATEPIAITISSGGGGGVIASEGSTQKILPQLAFGGGWYTALYFTNTNNAAVSFPVSFIGDAGSPLTITSVGGSSTTVNLAAHGTAVIEALNIGALSQGYASVSLPSGVTGYGIFHQNVPGAGVQEAVVPFSGASSTVSTLVWDETDFVTAVSIVNPTSSPTTVVVTVRDTNGIVIGTPTVNLPANNKVAVALRSLAGLGGMVGRRGSAEFTVSSGALAVLGLRFSGSAFTSIPTADR